MKRNCCRVNYKWVIIQNHIVILDKIKVALNLWNYAAKNLNDTTVIHTSNLADKKDFAVLKTENVASGLSNSKTKVDDLDVDKLKTLPVERNNSLEEISYLVSIEVVKNTKFKKLNTRVNSL